MRLVIEPLTVIIDESADNPLTHQARKVWPKPSTRIRMSLGPLSVDNRTKGLIYLDGGFVSFPA